MNRVFHVISNTHWDREWRYPFQRNRHMLVDMIDQVLDILIKEPDYRAFHLDSQTIVLNDYLEVKPHKKDIIDTLIKEKRLLVGPWYILPEEFQVGGENLIRNLLIGHKIAKQHGRVSKVGYSPFSWGQISQLPQIYAGFGINLIMFYRGVNSIDSPKAEFLWIGADGTKAVTSRFSTMPRYNFYFYIYRPAVHNEFFADVEYNWKRGGLPFHFSDEKLHDEDYFIIDPTNEYYPENIPKQVNSIIENQVNDFTTPNVIWMEGHDSSGPNIKTVQIIKDIKKAFPDLNVVHSTLEDYSDMLLNSVETDKLKIVTGERRSAQYDLRSGNMYGYTTSARMYLKQMNFNAERWLQFYAEPFNTFAGFLGKDIKDNYIDIAWEKIVQNSAHDSIGGCSLDEIHEDMVNRYKNSIEISKGVFERAMKYLAKLINTTSIYSIPQICDAFKLIDININIINPTNSTRSEITKLFLDIPKNYEVKNPNFIDYEGNIYRFVTTNIKNTQPVVEQMIDRPLYMDMNTYEGYIELYGINPFSVKSLKLIDYEITNKNNSIINKNSLSLENENLSVTLNNNGTINLYDKVNNSSYNEIGYFLDEGEEGFAWTNVPFEPFYTTINSKPEISIIENNEFKGAIKVVHNLLLPATYEDRKNKIENTEFKIELIISLTKHSETVDFNININNACESHRLRFMIPNGLNAKSSFGEGQFDVVERSLERPDTKDWVEQPMYDYPLHNFMDLSDNDKGIAVIVDGIKEYEVINDKQNTIAITLFRAFRFIIAPSSKQDYTFQKGSQCLGVNNYKISLLPHKGNWIDGDVYNKAICKNNSLSIVQTGDNNNGDKSEIRFFEVLQKDIQFSTIKKAESNLFNEYILRLYNPTNKIINSDIVFFTSITSAELVTLEEEPLRTLDVDSNKITTEFLPKKIITIKIKL